MKLRILVKLVEKLLGVASNGDTPRADMYLPERALAMAIVFLVGGTACAVYAVLSFATWAIVCAVIGIGFGIVLLMSWKNQTIRIISDTHFIYTTILGNQRTYAFSDIRGLRKNKDSMTLFVGNGKVHMESMAVLSPRLVSLINEALQKHA